MQAHRKKKEFLYPEFFRRRYQAAITLLFLSLCLGAQAQTPAQNQVPGTAPQTAEFLSSYEGQNVASIEIAGQPDMNEGQFMQQFVQHAGEPFSTTKINQTMAAIQRSGNFKQVQLQVEPAANGVRVLLVLQPATYFGIFEFPGAGHFSYSRLVQITNYPPQAPYNAGDVRLAQAGLLKFFRQQGFFKAEVRTRLARDPSHQIINVVFETTLHPRSKFGQLRFSGATDEQASKLRHDLQGIMARLRGAAIRPGKSYRFKTLANASRYLQGKLAKQGWLAARVELTGAEYHAATNRADISFHVDTGPKINVKIEGAHLWSWDRKSLLPVYQGVGVDPELVQEGSQALASYFQGKGYFDVTVNSHFQKQGSVDTILYQVAKGKKHKVQGVNISGNQPHSPQDPLQYVTVKKAHFFSRGNYSQDLVRSSVKNLTNVYQSEGFSSVKVTSNVLNKGSNVRVVFNIDQGPRDIVQSLRIEGAKTLTKAQFAPQGLKLSVGGPYSQKLVATDRKNITARYLQLGYLTATFRETAHSLSKNDPHQVQVVYHIYEGPRVYTTDVITLGRKQTQQRLINEDVSSIQPEHPLTATNLLTAESRLYDHTGVFDWAEVDPKRQVTTQEQEDVLVKVHEANRNEIRYGFGFEIINRGGSIPSGTVALPNLPPIGLPSNFSDEPIDLLRSQRNVRIYAKQSSRKGRVGFAYRLRRPSRSEWIRLLHRSQSSMVQMESDCFHFRGP